MNKKFALVIILLAMLAALALSTATLAQEDEGDANLCYDGAWYCLDPNDPAREIWNWACGWYWGNYLAGLIGTVPDWCGYTFTECQTYIAGQCNLTTTATPIYCGGRYERWSWPLGEYLGWSSTSFGLPTCPVEFEYTPLD